MSRPGVPVDGTGTVEDEPDWGAVHQTLLRYAPADFADGISEMVDDRPNARLISNVVSEQTEEAIPNVAGASDFLWAWGQFIDHDLDLTEAGETEFSPIIVFPGDPVFNSTEDDPAIITFTRVDPVDGTGETTPREYANEITAFIDAGMVYSSDPEVAASLLGDGPYLALDEDELLLETEGGVLAGDVRAAENVALTSLHTLFVREHNRWVDELKAENPDWTDEELFAGARARVEAEIQAITFNEFLPILVGEGTIEAYEGYDASVNPGIAVEFSTAAFRFGHSLLSSTVQRLNEDGSVIDAGNLTLQQAFFNPTEIYENGGIDPILTGLADGTANEVDTMVVEDVRSFLFAAEGDIGLDLAAINIQRGRDLGVASYNDLRESLGLARAESFSDITSDAALAAQLEALYGDVDLVDAWVGGLAEDAVEGGLLGELFAFIIVDQFTRIRDGDPFWSEGGSQLTDEEIEALWDTTLADVIEANTDIDTIQDEVFFAYDRLGGSEAGDNLFGGEGRNLLLGEGGNDWLVGAGGQDQLEGDNGSDTLDGGDDADILNGGAGRDIIYGNQGADNVDGGADGDRLFGGQGNDQGNGGTGQDTLSGNRGHDILYGNAGDDDIYGNLGQDLMFGGQGSDALYGGQDDDTLLGNLGDDTICGNIGDDVIIAGAGNDLILGNRGNDTLFGNAGNDVFSFGTDFGRDVIADYHAGDVIDLGPAIVIDINTNNRGLVLETSEGTILLTGVADPGELTILTF
ncbi:MAG: peroxidase [Alphaproteobacteria bacterium]|nr:peroxidase [Alphaproteobacteria bacterium SS10]